MTVWREMAEGIRQAGNRQVVVRHEVLTQHLTRMRWAGGALVGVRNHHGWTFSSVVVADLDVIGVRGARGGVEPLRTLISREAVV